MLHVIDYGLRDHAVIRQPQCEGCRLNVEGGCTVRIHENVDAPPLDLTEGASLLTKDENDNRDAILCTKWAKAWSQRVTWTAPGPNEDDEGVPIGDHRRLVATVDAEDLSTNFWPGLKIRRRWRSNPKVEGSDEAREDDNGDAFQEQAHDYDDEQEVYEVHDCGCLVVRAYRWMRVNSRIATRASAPPIITRHVSVAPIRGPAITDSNAAAANAVSASTCRIEAVDEPP